jgi:hypothetical protein
MVTDKELVTHGNQWGTGNPCMVIDKKTEMITSIIKREPANKLVSMYLYQFNFVD